MTPPAAAAPKAQAKPKPKPAPAPNARPKVEAAAVWVTASSLVLWDINPRRNEAAIEPIALCLLELGWGRPIVAQQSTSRIIAGNTTYKAAALLAALKREGLPAKKDTIRRIAGLDLATDAGAVALGKLLDALEATDWQRIPARFRDLGDEDAYRLALADNKLGEIADWDEQLLAQVFDKLHAAGASTPVTGFSPAEIADIIERSRPPEPPGDEKDPEGGVGGRPSEPITQLGTMWLLGPHRLFCGDALNPRDRQILLGDDVPDLIHTDPPYGMNVAHDFNAKVRGAAGPMYTKAPNEHRPVIGDDADYDPRDLIKAFAAVKEQFWWGADYYAERIPDAKAGSFIVWDKRCDGLEDVEWSTSEFELCWSRQRHHRKIARMKWFGVHGMQLEDTKRRVHPTQKPVALVEWLLEQWGREARTVLDLYGGSGSTLIACQRLGKAALVMELDPGYCDVIVARWEAYTGQIAKRM